MILCPCPVRAVQIPPSTTYAVTPMKRPLEEDGEEKSPSKKKKKLQRKGSVGVELCCDHDAPRCVPTHPLMPFPSCLKRRRRSRRRP